MLDIIKNGDVISVKDGNKKEISFDTDKNLVLLDGLDVNFPGEYEKSGILAEIKEIDSTLIYSFTIDSKHVFIVPTEKLELKEEIISFFGDIDVLIILGTKESIKIFENIEAKVVIPYSETKDIFLNSLGQHIESVETYRIKGDLDGEKTEFINLG
ncbi:MAG: hypothetical protein PHR68_02510 [Candidatus Gracilibacteria bacterium]|nr:hypothetical protein [Candidatus Gracilibacteria bacterium]